MNGFGFEGIPALLSASKEGCCVESVGFGVKRLGAVCGVAADAVAFADPAGDGCFSGIAFPLAAKEKGEGVVSAFDGGANGLTAGFWSEVGACEPDAKGFAGG